MDQMPVLTTYQVRETQARLQQSPDRRRRRRRPRPARAQPPDEPGPQSVSDQDHIIDVTV